MCVCVCVFVCVLSCVHGCMLIAPPCRLVRGEGVQYLVKWKELGYDEASWESLSHLQSPDCPAQGLLPALSAYEKLLAEGPRARQWGMVQAGGKGGAGGAGAGGKKKQPAVLTRTPAYLAAGGARGGSSAAHKCDLLLCWLEDDTCLSCIPVLWSSVFDRPRHVSVFGGHAILLMHNCADAHPPSRTPHPFPSLSCPAPSTATSPLPPSYPTTPPRLR